MRPDTPDPKADERERVAIPLDPVAALRALLAVDPDAPSASNDAERKPSAAKRADGE